MRVISKQISLENLTSRLPGVVPAYRERDGKVYKFDNTSLEKREYAFPSNYGLVPMSVKIDGKCLSWETISEWYHFFTDYNHLLNDWGHCGIKYRSAVDYYNNESKNGYASQMIYGTLIQTYEDLDDLYGERAFAYDKIVNYYIPSVEIIEEYQDYWHAKKLFYPDIIKWNGWFKERVDIYAGKTIDDCIDTDDCCDCREYFNRGGAVMANLLQAAYNSIQSKIASIETCDPYMMTDVSLQVSIDDLGEFSIFSEEYELGVDYRGAYKYGDTDNTRGGTVVSISGNAMTLLDGAGFDFNTVYMEKTFYVSKCMNEECGYMSEDIPFSICPICGSDNVKQMWTEHKGDTEVNGVKEEDDYTRAYQNGIDYGQYYGFTSSLRKVTGTSESSVRTQLYETYPVIEVNAVYANGALYDVSEEEWGYYKGNTSKLFYVYREEYTETPYTVINGSKVYADINPADNEHYFYFPFFVNNGQSTSLHDSCGNPVFNRNKYKWYPRTRNGGTINFITFNGTAYRINDTYITINGNTYQWVIGTFTNEDGNFYVGKNEVVYKTNEYGELNSDSNYTYDPATKTAKKISNNTAIVYETGLLKGKADSKFTEFRMVGMLVDDTGEPIEGRYDVGSNLNHQPPEGEVLDLLYEVGNTSGNMIPFDVEGDQRCQAGTYYFGDMLKKMYFYYKTLGGVKQSGLDWNKSSLYTIQHLVKDDETDDRIVYCDVEYIVGGTFTGQSKYDSETGLYIGTEYGLAGGNFSSGVTYKETVMFVKTQVEYKLALGKEGQIPTTFNTPTAHTLSYPVVCYVLKQNKEEMDSSFNTKYSNTVAEFEMKLPGNGGWCGYGTGTELFPVFREEYRLGVATMQNLDVDIYIGRGTNAAFEKHIKLGEVTSMEALEQYTNGYFKMMEN